MKHNLKRLLSGILVTVMLVGMMPTTTFAASTTTVNSASELQNAINNAGDGDTIKLGANITFSDTGQIRTVADVYKNSQILTYDLKEEAFSERRPYLGGIPMGSWENLYDPAWKTVYDFTLPLELRPEHGSTLYVEDGNVLRDSYNREIRVKENGDATTYLLIDGKNLTIDLNGKTINATHNDAYFSALFVTGGSTVTIKGNGGITSSGTVVTAHGNGTKVTIQNGSFTGATAVAALYNAELHLNGGIFTGADVAEKEVKKEVVLEKEQTSVREDVLGDEFGWEQIHTISKYTGTAIWTVSCSTLYSQQGSICIGEDPSISPSFQVPGNGNLFVYGTIQGTMKISGGTFGKPPYSGYVVSGSRLLQKDDGTCEVVSQNDSRSVAEVSTRVGAAYNTTYCTSLASAMKLVQADSTVTLLQDISGEQILNNNSTYTLDLRGHTINGNVTVKTGNVTIKNGTITYSGTGNALKTDGSGATLTVNCTVNASSGTALSAGYNNSGGKVNSIGGTYTGKLGTSGGTLTITGGRYKPNDPSAYLASGLYAVLDADRFYMVTDTPFIQIWNKDDLLAFAQKVNNGDSGANAVLMADIDLNGVTWTPIGSDSYRYTGAFNGNGHSIKNFNSTSGGLFDYIGVGGTVSNVTIASGSIKKLDDRNSLDKTVGAIANASYGTIQGCFNHAAVEGWNSIGGIVGNLYDGGTVQQCGNHGNIKAEQFVGGIVGDKGLLGVITNCYNTGQVSATAAKQTAGSVDLNGNQEDIYYTGGGGICGPQDYSGHGYYSEASNCFNYGTFTVKDNYFVPVSMRGSNNYHLNSTASGCAATGYTSTAKTENVFKSGEVAWLLNGSKADGVWYQNLGTDTYPVLDSTHARVYKSGNSYTNYTFNSLGTINNVTVLGGTTAAVITSKLPKTVSVNSTKPDGGLTAEVSWDTSPLSNYDPDNWDAQTITLNGTAYVTGLVNGGEKSVSIKINVSAVTPSSISVKTYPNMTYSDGDTLDLSGAKYTVTYNDVNNTKAELGYDSPGVTYSLSQGTVLSKTANNGQTLTMSYEGKSVTLGTLTVRSTDNTIQSIDVGETRAVLGNDGGYTVTLPKGSSLPGESGITITPTDNSVQSVTKSLVEGRNDYWEITVAAESGSTAIYYLQVNIEGLNDGVIVELTQKWNDINKTWNPTQEEVQKGTSETGDDNNLSYEMQLQAWLLQTMAERGMNIPANVTAAVSFSQATKWAETGDRYNYRNGVDGNFEFSITFTATQGSEDTHKRVTFDSQSGTIIATPYAVPDYTVHFNSNSGTFGSDITVKDITVKEDMVIGSNAPANPTKDTYTFLGWYTEQDGGEEWNVDNDKVVTDGMTLYAHWKLNEYTVKYVADGTTVHEEIVKHGSNVANIPTVPTKTGYTQTAPTWDKDGTNITDDTTITAVYTINKYTVTYVADGQTVGTPQTIEHGSNATPEAVPNKEGYDQVDPSWNKDGKNITADTTITAQYTINQYTVTLPESESQIGYTLTADKATVDYKGNVVLTFTLKEGYTANAETNFAVKINGTPATLTNDTYTVSDVKENIIVTVEGVSDITAPTAEISIAENKWNSFLNTITFGKFFKETQSVTITSADAGSQVKDIYYYLAEAAKSLDEVKAIADWNEYEGSFNISPDHEYVIYAKVTDNAGNITYISSDGLVLDATAPAITGIENNGTYYGDTSFTVEESYLDTVKVDDNNVSLDGQNSYTITADNGNHTVEITDKAGNVTEYSITVYKNYTVTYVADGQTVSTQTVGHGKDAAAPQIPEKTGYNQTAPTWDKDGKNITADTTIEAVYIINNYTVTVPESQEGYELKADTESVNYGGQATFTYELKDGYTETERFAIKVNGQTVTFAEGKYTVHNIDENIKVTVDGVEDITAPTAEITLGTNKWNSFLNTITFGKFFNKTQSVDITAEDAGSQVKDVSYYLAEAAMSLDEVKEIIEWKEYKGSFSIDPDHEYVIYAKVTDNAGNEAYISSDGLVLDATAPAIAGIEDGKTYYKEVEFTVTDSYLSEIEVNGEEVSVAGGKYTLTVSPDKQTVKAYDKAGNVSAEITVTVEAEHSFTWGEWYTDSNGNTSRDAHCACGFDLTITVPHEELPVGGLEEESEVQGKDLHMVVETDLREIDDESMKKIESQLPDDISAFYVDITLKDVLGDVDVTETTRVLEVPIAFDFEDKLNVTVYRNHEGTVTELKELSARPSENFEDGTFYADKAEDIIYVYSNKFSTYGIAYHSHELTHVPAKDATSKADGNIEYWYCKGCDKYFKDADAAEEITKAETVIKYSGAPNTGDNNNQILWFILLIGSAVTLLSIGTYIGRNKRSRYRRKG